MTDTPNPGMARPLNLRGDVADSQREPITALRERDVRRFAGGNPRI